MRRRFRVSNSKSKRFFSYHITWMSIKLRTPKKDRLFGSKVKIVVGPTAFTVAFGKKKKTVLYLQC